MSETTRLVGLIGVLLLLAFWFLWTLAESTESNTFEYFVMRGDRKMRIGLEQMISATPEGNHVAYGYHYSAFQLEKNRLPKYYEAREGHFSRGTKGANEIILNIDTKGTITFASDVMLETFGLAREEVLGAHVGQLNPVFGINEQDLIEEVKHDYYAQAAVSLENQEDKKWVFWTFEAVLDAEFNVEFIIGTGREITQFVKGSETHRLKEHTDYLTGLLNQQGLFDCMHDQNDIQKATVVFFELGSFSKINDYYGHHFGDMVLKEVANALQIVKRDQCIISRFTGDQFVLICDRQALTEKELLLNLENRIPNEIVIAGHKIEIEKRIGYALFPEDHPVLERVIPLAGLALRHSVKANQSIIAYKPEMREQINKNIKIETKLREALDQENIEIHFQEIIDTSTNRVVAVEELARWYDSELGEITPIQLFKAAKEANLLNRLERYLIDRSLSVYVELRKQERYKEAMLSLNIAPSSLLDLNFLYFLNHCAQRYGIKNHRISVEISESTFVNNIDVCVHHIKAYKDAGYKIALDDFGKAYSSLAVLDNLEFDIIKIDAVFTANIEDLKSQEIIKMVRKIAMLSDKKIVVEGVEKASQQKQLAELGCNVQQGFYFHKPSRL